MSKKVAVLGLGRSGLAVAKACLAAGDEVTVYDQKPRNDPKIQPLLSELEDLGASFVGEFEGNFGRIFDQLVTSPGVDMRKSFLKDAVRAGVEVISEVEFAFRISKAPIIAITGTNGKSTTTVMTYLALKAAGEEAILCGNIYGSGYEEVPLTVAALNSTPNQVLVAEISSFQLEWVVNFRPKCAGITNITPDHLNRYDGFDQYANTKRRIFDQMAEGDYIVANAGDMQTFPTNQSLRDRGQGHPQVRFYGTAGVDASFDSSSLKISVSEKVEQLPFRERHNLINACHASVLAQSFLEYRGKLSPLERVEKVIEGLKGFKGLSHRMEDLGSKNGVKVINNSMCTNPAAVVASSSSLASRQHLLIGGIKKEYSFEPVKEFLVRNKHLAYLFGKDAGAIASEIGGDFKIFSTMEEAFASATEEAIADEVIMLAPGCASMDQFCDFVERGEIFKRIAKEWLYGTQTTSS